MSALTLIGFAMFIVGMMVNMVLFINALSGDSMNKSPDSTSSMPDEQKKKSRPSENTIRVGGYLIFTVGILLWLYSIR